MKYLFKVQLVVFCILLSLQSSAQKVAAYTNPEMQYRNGLELFNKNQFVKDFYMMNTSIGAMQYTRNTFCRMSKAFRWYGPVHEFIVCEVCFCQNFFILLRF